MTTPARKIGITGYHGSTKLFDHLNKLDFQEKRQKKLQLNKQKPSQHAPV